MRIDIVFYAYMAVVGVLAGSLLIAVPASGNLSLPPYFWILIAVALFDGGGLVLGYKPAAMLTMTARMIGFGLGLVLMFGIAFAGGVPLRFV